MANKYTHDELAERIKSPGWRLVTGKKEDRSIMGTLDKLLHVTHHRRKNGQAPGLIEEIKTGIEVDMISIENLWQYLGLPV